MLSPAEAGGSPIITLIKIRRQTLTYVLLIYVINLNFMPQNLYIGGVKFWFCWLAESKGVLPFFFACLAAITLKIEVLQRLYSDWSSHPLPCVPAEEACFCTYYNAVLDTTLTLRLSFVTNTASVVCTYAALPQPVPKSWCSVTEMRKRN